MKEISLEQYVGNILEIYDTFPWPEKSHHNTSYKATKYREEMIESTKLCDNRLNEFYSQSFLLSASMMVYDVRQITTTIKQTKQRRVWFRKETYIETVKQYDLVIQLKFIPHSKYSRLLDQTPIYLLSSNSSYLECSSGQEISIKNIKPMLSGQVRMNNPGQEFLDIDERRPLQCQHHYFLNSNPLLSAYDGENYKSALNICLLEM